MKLRIPSQIVLWEFGTPEILQAFATIKSTTGISDIEEIVKIFVKLEERNFSLLTSGVRNLSLAEGWASRRNNRFGSFIKRTVRKVPNDRNCDKHILFKYGLCRALLNLGFCGKLKRAMFDQSNL